MDGYVRHFLIALALFCIPANALAAAVDSSLIPDGDYTVTVEKIVDAKHLRVKMDNGVESVLPAAKTVTFDVTSHVTVAKVFVYKGIVITYQAEH